MEYEAVTGLEVHVQVDPCPLYPSAASDEGFGCDLRSRPFTH